MLLLLLLSPSLFGADDVLHEHQHREGLSELRRQEFCMHLRAHPSCRLSYVLIGLYFVLDDSFHHGAVRQDSWRNCRQISSQLQSRQTILEFLKLLLLQLKKVQEARRANIRKEEENKDGRCKASRRKAEHGQTPTCHSLEKSLRNLYIHIPEHTKDVYRYTDTYVYRYRGIYVYTWGIRTHGVCRPIHLPHIAPSLCGLCMQR